MAAVESATFRSADFQSLQRLLVVRRRPFLGALLPHGFCRRGRRGSRSGFLLAVSCALTLQRR